MKKHWLDILSKSEMFRSITVSEIDEALACFEPEIIHYRKNEVAVLAGDRLKGIGIVLSGRVSVAKDTFSGGRIILNVLQKGGIFGEIAAFSENRISQATVLAKEDCTVIYISPDSIIGRCAKSCGHHRMIETNVMGLIARKAVQLMHKIDYMSIKGMRAKICTFLYDSHLQSDNNLQFILPFNRSEMADYLNVSRPSMSRELGRLRNEGLIEFFSASVRILDMPGLKRYVV